MKMSKMFVQTLRETPADAEVVSHQLLIRAGYIRMLTSGIYSYLPLMFRVFKKVENIVRDEMDKSGAQELLMPILQPKEVWEESGRWEAYGKELMRLKDRHDREMALGPTHEEIITLLAKNQISSYKQLPINLYQVQSKFRDERRPRFGLLRGREFIMKDAYSFDVDEEGLDKAYNVMAQAYEKIFIRCGLDTKMVRSDSGAIGGDVSHEYMVLTETDCGENDVVFCVECDYAGNTNRAESILPKCKTDGEFKESNIVDTPNVKSIEELTKFFNIEPSAICKSLVYIVDKKIVVALIRGDLTIEETKLKNFIDGNEIRIATDEEIKELMEKSNLTAEAGFIGPKGIKAQVIADESVKGLKNFVVGVNQNDKHLAGANWGVDLDLPKSVADIRLAQRDELCIKCNAKLDITRGIEVGNIFKLGTKYSAKMNAKFTDEKGGEKPYIMGCYGIGISRTAAAAIEKYHDKDGIKWPMSIAPYHVIVVPVNVQDEQQWAVANELYDQLKQQNIEAVLDDREYRAGVKFKDADLIGFPVRITVGKTIKEGDVEVKVRMSGEQIKISKDEAVKHVVNIINSELEKS